MPKTYGNLWPSITSWENLHSAYLEARKGKRYTAGVMNYTEHLEENLTNLQNHLAWKTWQPGDFRSFWVYEPKKRMIQAPCFADRAAHHALYRVVFPLFERKFIRHSYACRKGKGTLAASNALTVMLRKAQTKWGKVYALKCDISRYFPSVHHNILTSILQRTIRDQNVLWMCETALKCCGFSGRGMPIGSLTSQLFANVYLDQLDHYIKDGLGESFYVRYMDDFIILGKDKGTLKNDLIRIGSYLDEKLGLKLNPKTTIVPASQGLYFAGYRHWTTHRLPRKINVKRAKKRFARISRLYSTGKIGLEKVRSIVMSFLGYMQHCKSHKTTTSTLARLSLVKCSGGNQC